MNLILPTAIDGAGVPRADARTDAQVARAFLAAVVTRDERSLRALLAPDIWSRAMVVREVLERHDAENTIALFHGWFGTAHTVQVLWTTTYPVATREAVAYRLRLLPEWAPDVWHVIEQTGYLRVQQGRIRRLDLVCTGFVPEWELPAERRSTAYAS